jgi:hypothetical protein
VFDQHVARRFAVQHGLLTRDQALDGGASPRMIDHRLFIGRWVRVGPGEGK